MSEAKTYDRKVLNGWVFYDWANSVYSLVISTAVFPLFYSLIFRLGKENAILFGTPMDSTAVITYATGFIFLIVALVGPLLSGIADYVDNKRLFLKIFCVLGSVSCSLLYFFSPAYLELSIALYVLAGVGFWGSLIYYNAYLPEIAPKSLHDRLSAKGFSMGYLGSVILLIFCLVLIVVVFGTDNYFGYQLSFLLTGLWWFIFGMISIYRLPTSDVKVKLKRKLLSNGYRELARVYKEMRANAKLKRFLAAFFFFNTGVQTIILIAVYFGDNVIQWGDTNKSIGLIISIILIQLLAILGARLMAELSDRVGNIKALLVSVTIWLIGCCLAFFIDQPWHFYSLAVLVGFVLGGVQSVARSTYSKLLPKTKDTSSYFSFYDISEKVGIVIGMTIFGTAKILVDEMKYTIIPIIVIFLIGWLLLISFMRKFKSLEDE